MPDEAPQGDTPEVKEEEKEEGEETPTPTPGSEPTPGVGDQG